MEQGQARRKAEELRQRGKNVVAKTLRETPAGYVTGGWPGAEDEWEVFYLVPGTKDVYLPWFHAALHGVVDPADHEE